MNDDPVSGEITGWFLDVYPDARRGAVLWILGEDGRRHLLHHPFGAAFYVQGSECRLAQLARALSQRFGAAVTQSAVIRKDLFSGEVQVLAIHTPDPIRQRRVFYWAYPRFPDLDYFDVDVPFSLRYAARHGAMPLSHCRLQVSADLVTEMAYCPTKSADDAVPPLRLLALAPNLDPGYLDPTELTAHFDGCGRTYSLADPALSLKRLNRLICEYDPDIILTKWGDTWLFPLMLDYAKRHNHALALNRDPAQEVIRRKAFSYHTYGRVLHRGQQVHLAGRWHIDQTNAVMYGEYQLSGVLEQARITGLPVQEVARKSPGAGITAMQMITAMRRGVLVPYHKSQVETFKTPAQLIAADRGGLVGQPISGVHHQVAGIDFFSMYPQIMARYNISPETLQLNHTDTTIPVPGTGAAVEQNFTGFVGQTLQGLLERRYALKHKMSGMSVLDSRYFDLKARSNALKWLLVVCFGYLGHKHFRWMKIESHEAVTAFGREMLLQAKQTAEDHGFRVLYFNVDGLYVQKQGAIEKQDFAALLAAIQARTGLRINLDGFYRWIVFLPSRTDERVPVANRYFGLLEGGKLKVRGIEIRRHDTPPFVYKTQTELLHLLARTAEGEPLEIAIPAAVWLLERRAADLRSGRIRLEDLVVTQRLSRDLVQYRQPSPAAKAAAQLASIDKPMSAGQTVRFLYVKGGTGVLAWRAGAPFDYRQVNLQEYLKLLVRAASNVLSPLGLSEDTLARLVAVSGQITMDLDGVRVAQKQIVLSVQSAKKFDSVSLKE